MLRLLARGSGHHGLAEIAAALGLPKGTAHGILRTLQRVEFVEQDQSTGQYRLGAALLHLGTSYLDANELRSLTRRTIVRPAALERVLTEVRGKGWGSEAEEYMPGEASIAAPIRIPGGLVVGAIGISGSVDRICDPTNRPKAALVSQVSHAAEAVSRALGS